MYLKLLFSVIICIVTFFSAKAQATASKVLDLSTVNLSSEGDNWVFFNENETNHLFIDLETFEGQITDLRIKDNKSEVKYKDDLLNVPFDAIYEIDLSFLEKGEYVVEVRTYKGIVEKRILLN